jgi:hypothetical protein
MGIIKDIIRTIFSHKIDKEAINKKPKMVVTDENVGINPNWITTPKKKITKLNQVKNHLIEKGQIDSWTAINLYGATRLSAIIFDLKKAGYNIRSVRNTAFDRNNKICNFTTYIFKENEIN